MKIINAWICRITGNSVLPIFGDIIIEDGIIKKIKENFNTRTQRSIK